MIRRKITAATTQIMIRVILERRIDEEFGKKSKFLNEIKIRNSINEKRFRFYIVCITID